LPSSRGYISVDSLRLLLCKLREIVEIAFEGIGNVVGCFGVSELKDRIVVERPVLCFLVLAPNLWTFDAKNLHANTSWCRYVVGEKLRCQRGVPHDDIVCAWPLEHSLSEFWCKIIMDNELSNNTLGLSLADVSFVTKSQLTPCVFG